MAVQGPRLRLGTEPEAAVSQSAAIIRAAMVVLTLTNPLLAALTALLVAIALRIAKLRAWWLIVAGALATALAVTMRAGASYLQWVYDVLDVLVPRVQAGEFAGMWAAVASLAAERWSVWLVAQLPFALALALLLAGLLVMLRRRHAADWRKPRADSKPMSRKESLRKVARLRQWPQKKPAATIEGVDIRLGLDLITGEATDLPADALRRHMFIDGASGFGKTTDIFAIMRGLVEAPAARELMCPIVYVNLKPDPEVTETTQRIAYAAGREFVHLTLDGELHYNPILRGTAKQIATMIVEVENAAEDGGFSEPYHLSNGQLLLGYAVQALDALIEKGATYKRGTTKRSWRRDLLHLDRIMRLDVLCADQNMKQYPRELRLDLTELRDELAEDKRKRESCEGMRGRVGKILVSAAGDVFKADPHGLDLRAELLRGAVIMADLDSVQDKIGAQMVTNYLVKDLQSTLARMHADGWRLNEDGEVERLALIIIDEFSALGGDAVLDLLQRGRTAGGGILLATQDIGSIIKVDAGLLTSILTNTSTHVVHVQEEYAQDYADRWGTTPTMKETVQTYDDRTILGTLTSKSGQGSLREVEEYIISPNRLRQLRPGEAIIRTRDPWAVRQVLVRRSLPAAVPKTTPEPEPALEDAPPAAAGDPQQPTHAAPEAAQGKARDDKPAGEPEPATPQVTDMFEEKETK